MNGVLVKHMTQHKGPASIIFFFGCTLAYYLSKEYYQNKHAKEFQQKLESELKEHAEQVYQYTDENLQNAKKGTLKQSRFVSTGCIYASPQFHMTLMGKNYVIKIFRDKCYAFPASDFKNLEEKWKEILDSFDSQKKFQNEVFKLKVSNPNLMEHVVFSNKIKSLGENIKPGFLEK